MNKSTNTSKLSKLIDIGISLSKEKNINAFQKYLSQKGFISTVRTTRGDDIDGACGQLIGNLNKAAHGKKAIERQISA